MTDLQVKYQALQETKRANKAQEALKEIDVQSSAELRAAQTQKTLNEVNEVLAKIDNIKADTSLTNAQKQNEISKTVQGWINAIRSGISLIVDPSGFKSAILDKIPLFGKKGSSLFSL